MTREFVSVRSHVLIKLQAAAELTHVRKTSDGVVKMKNEVDRLKQEMEALKLEMKSFSI